MLISTDLLFGDLRFIYSSECLNYLWLHFSFCGAFQGEVLKHLAKTENYILWNLSQNLRQDCMKDLKALWYAQVSGTSHSAYHFLHCFQKQSHYYNISVLFNLAAAEFLLC